MAKEDKLTVLDVIFSSEDEQTYSYISDEDGYEVGDLVAVPTGKDNHEAIVCVKAVGKCTTDKLPFPDEKMKRVIRRSTREEYEEKLKEARSTMEKSKIPEREFCIYSEKDSRNHSNVFRESRFHLS